jgi:hypothetical protein
MEKPKIFFSHSSRDSKILTKLKEQILLKCKNSVEIFLSSDGQSIPFGKNWVHQIEEALNNATIFFIFLTPNSVNSKWVHFEAGHAYSKKLKVIPIGLFGQDLNSLTPPLSLLQGFNITDTNGLNNIIAIINKHFHFSLEESFNHEDYNELLALADDFIISTFTKVFHSVLIEFDPKLRGDYNYRERSSKFPINFKNYLQQNHFESQEYGDNLYFEGADMNRIRYPNSDDYHYKLIVDPHSFSKSIELVKNCIRFAYDNIDKYSFEILFKQDFTCLTEISQLSGRLMNYNCHFTDKGDMYYKDISFHIKKGWSEDYPEMYFLVIRFDLKTFNVNTLNELLDIFFQSGICQHD